MENLNKKINFKDFHLSKPWQTAFRIVLIYGVIASIWIMSSDIITRFITDDLTIATRVSMFKGFFFVVVTSIILFFQISHYAHRIENVLSRMQDKEDRLSKALTSSVEVLQKVCAVRDPYTAGHQQRVSNIAAGIAAEMSLSNKEVADIKLAGLIHDVGKMSVPTEILTKPGKLTPIEYQLVKEHAQSGYDIVAESNMPDNIVEMVQQHHERCDGSGYPLGLKSEDILLEAKILMVADVVEAMASYRPYRPALGIDSALEEIEKGAGTLYDKDVADACVQLFREHNFNIE